MNIDTKCVQAGYQPKNGEARVLPIYQSTTFRYDTPEEMGDLFDLKKSGYFYSRIGNPTNNGLEEKMVALEGGSGALTTASGMSATTLAILTLAKSGDNIVSMSTIYGGTYNLLGHTLPKLGIECRFFTPDTAEEEIESLIDEKTKVIFCETLANPAMDVADFETLSKIAKKYGIVLMADNTLPTPYLCRPFDFGVNVIVHASTKYLDGHACALGGVIVDGGNFEFKGNPRYEDFNKPDPTYHGLVFAELGSVAFIIRTRVVGMRDIGAMMAPMNAFLTNMGIETLHLRMTRHSENAFKIAKALENHPAVEWVKYAGLESDPNYAKAQKYFRGGMASGMVTFGIKGGKESAVKFQRALKLIAIVTHIADARSCVLHPATTTHRQLSVKDLADCGITENLIRLSVGIEDSEDILNDVLQALEASQK